MFFPGFDSRVSFTSGSSFVDYTCDSSITMSQESTSSLSDFRSDDVGSPPPVWNPLPSSNRSYSSYSGSATSGSGAAGHVGGNGHPPEPGSAAVSVSVEADEASTRALSVWDLEHVKKEGNSKKDGGWTCLWCKQFFKHWNATKCLYHLAKIVGKDVRICRAAHDKKHRELYHSMLSAKDKHSTTLKAREKEFQAKIAEGQQSLKVMLDASRQRASGAMTPASDQQTAEGSMASLLTMAIADFVHCSGLSFSVTSGQYFKNILKYARCVPVSYNPPNRNALSTNLLKLNYDHRMQR